MKVMLVDDERIAVEHVKRLISWEQHGFEVAATATNGKSGLRLCQEHRPQIMIVDIRMPVMDGLELIRAVAEQNLDVVFIVMSAYEDFEYARQAISLGSVSSYLIKHEVDRGKLLQELFKAKSAWEAAEERRQTLSGERIKDLLTGKTRNGESGLKLSPPLGLIMFYPDQPFSPSPSDSTAFTDIHPAGWGGEETKICSDQDVWRLNGHFHIEDNLTFALFNLENKGSGSARASLRHISAMLHTHLKRRFDQSVSVFYGIYDDSASPLSAFFRNFIVHARHSVFFGCGTLACTDENQPISSPAISINRHYRLDHLHQAIEQKNGESVSNAIKKLFNDICCPSWDLKGMHAVVAGLTTLLSECRIQLGLPDIDPFDAEVYEPVYHIDGISDRFNRLFSDLITVSNEAGKLSNKLLKALSYIHEHYHEDINIEDVSFATRISPSYLHQMFKREMERTFLDYLTAYRIEQAKRILRSEEAKMTEVATRVGYRSAQHFSQVFKRMTGTLPHRYRDGGFRR